MVQCVIIRSYYHTITTRDLLIPLPNLFYLVRLWKSEFKGWAFPPTVDGSMGCMGWSGGLTVAGIGDWNCWGPVAKSIQRFTFSYNRWLFATASTGGPRYSRTFYLQIRLFTSTKGSNITIFQSKMAFLSANSRFAVQNDGPYLPRITRETCISF